MPDVNDDHVNLNRPREAEIDAVDQSAGLDVPQSSREDAIHKVLAYYSPTAESVQSTTHGERRDAAINAIIEQVRSAGPSMQLSYMRALKVNSLLADGVIERLAPEDPIDAARSYANAVREDALLSMRLMQKVGAGRPAQPGESMDEYFIRLSGIDFALGHAECESPRLYESAMQLQADRMCDSDGVADEDRIERENIHLIEQALKKHLRAEENALGAQGYAHASDVVDVRALGLDLDVFNGGSGECESSPHEYPRER